MNSSIVEVSQALMPKNTELVTCQVVDSIQMWVQLYFLLSRTRKIMTAARRGLDRVMDGIVSGLRWEGRSTGILKMERIKIKICLVTKTLIIEKLFLVRSRI